LIEMALAIGAKFIRFARRGEQGRLRPNAQPKARFTLHIGLTYMTSIDDWGICKCG
jgi:hypothetical protein